MAPAVTRQRQVANMKLAMTFYPLPESSGRSYFKITDKIAILKMEIKSSSLIKKKKARYSNFLFETHI